MGSRPIKPPTPEGHNWTDTQPGHQEEDIALLGNLYAYVGRCLLEEEDARITFDDATGMMLFLILLYCEALWDDGIPNPITISAALAECMSNGYEIAMAMIMRKGKGR
jgi:hypothetical protein